MGYKHLDWDSDFFRFKVAHICNAKSAGDLREAINSLIKNDYRLAYWETARSKNLSQAAERCGGRLVDMKITFSFRLDNYDRSSDERLIKSYRNRIPDQRMYDLAIQSGEYSRFKVDPRISAADFSKLYRLWIKNSVNGKLADIVYVYRKRNKIVGLITLKEDEFIGRIGLIAVDRRYRGKSIGTNLMDGAKNYFKNRGCKIIEVTTQKENKPACRFYLKNGFQIKKERYFYHFWL